jgi:hypothetical protein
MIAPLLAPLLAGIGFSQDPDELWMEVRDAFVSGDRLAIAGMIADPAGDAETVSRYFAIERALYWEARDLPAAVFVAEQGIAYSLARAAITSENSAMARQLRGAASRIAFNLASSTWPGWDEPGIRITPQQRELGWASARLALRISEELNSGPAALANGTWMVGAHQLAGGQFRDAMASFRRAALFGEAAQDRGTVLVSEGFVAITEIAADDDAEEARRRLEEIRAMLEREVDNPESWTVQFDSAYRVFIERAELPPTRD